MNNAKDLISKWVVTQPGICNKCRNLREAKIPEFKNKKKHSIGQLEKTGHKIKNTGGCPFQPGYGYNEKINEIKNIDILFIAEGHSGSIKWNIDSDFMSEYKTAWDYHHPNSLSRIDTFYQYSIRNLLKNLEMENKEIKWYMTDLIKCYIFNRDESNVQIAARNCEQFLKDQIEIFRPKLVVCFGYRTYVQYLRRIAGVIKVKKPIHGEKKALMPPVIFSYFPSIHNADRWVKHELSGESTLLGSINNCLARSTD